MPSKNEKTALEAKIEADITKDAEIAAIEVRHAVDMLKSIEKHEGSMMLSRIRLVVALHKLVKSGHLQLAETNDYSNKAMLAWAKGAAAILFSEAETTWQNAPQSWRASLRDCAIVVHFTVKYDAFAPIVKVNKDGRKVEQYVRAQTKSAYVRTKALPTSMQADPEITPQGVNYSDLRKAARVALLPRDRHATPFQSAVSKLILLINKKDKSGLRFHEIPAPAWNDVGVLLGQLRRLQAEYFAATDMAKDMNIGYAQFVDLVKSGEIKSMAGGKLTEAEKKALGIYDEAVRPYNENKRLKGDQIDKVAGVK